MKTVYISASVPIYPECTGRQRSSDIKITLVRLVNGNHNLDFQNKNKNEVWKLITCVKFYKIITFAKSLFFSKGSVIEIHLSKSLQKKPNFKG